MITRIKICGITRLEDAEVAVAAGADALGLNFATISPRRVPIAQAARIADHVAGAIRRVGLFVDAPAADVRAVIDAVALDVLQFQGEESGAWCGQFGLPYLKAIRVRGPLDLPALEAEYAGACALLLDAYVPGRPGGTGHQFDWALWPPQARLPLALAGGLTPDNVAEAVTRLRPWAVDVSGGVEGPVKGIKDADRVRRFIAEVRRCEALTDTTSR
ncbi:MAG: phosphoribosylanthranilate isomerase [Pseudomonadales bacterium]